MTTDPLERLRAVAADLPDSLDHAAAWAAIERARGGHVSGAPGPAVSDSGAGRAQRSAPSPSDAAGPEPAGRGPTPADRGHEPAGRGHVVPPAATRRIPGRPRRRRALVAFGLAGTLALAGALGLLVNTLDRGGDDDIRWAAGQGSEPAPEPLAGGGVTLGSDPEDAVTLELASPTQLEPAQAVPTARAITTPTPASAPGQDSAEPTASPEASPAGPAVPPAASPSPGAGANRQAPGAVASPSAAAGASAAETSPAAGPSALPGDASAPQRVGEADPEALGGRTVAEFLRDAEAALTAREAAGGVMVTTAWYSDPARDAGKGTLDPPYTAYEAADGGYAYVQYFSVGATGEFTLRAAEALDETSRTNVAAVTHVDYQAGTWYSGTRDMVGGVSATTGPTRWPALGVGQNLNVLRALLSDLDTQDAGAGGDLFGIEAKAEAIDRLDGREALRLEATLADVPLEPTDLERGSSVVLWLDTQTLLPVRLENSRGAGAKVIRTFTWKKNTTAVFARLGTLNTDGLAQTVVPPDARLR